MIAAAVFVVGGCSSAPDGFQRSAPSAPAVDTSSTPGGTASNPSSVPPSMTTSASVSKPPVPTSYAPPADGPAVTQACPYLTALQVEAATGDAVRTVRTIASGAYPACVFLGSDGRELVRIRVLTFESDVQAALAVDHYLPADRSSLETRPPGWEGGSMRAADGSVVGVHRNGVAVIVTAEVLTQPARDLARQAIMALGL